MHDDDVVDVAGGSYGKHLEYLHMCDVTAFFSGITGERTSPVPQILSKQNNKEDAPETTKHTDVFKW